MIKSNNRKYAEYMQFNDYHKAFKVTIKQLLLSPDNYKWQSRLIHVIAILHSNNKAKG